MQSTMRFRGMTAALSAKKKWNHRYPLIGTAGWSLPRSEQHRFPGSGSHLERYASRFSAAEINSSFHRSHRRATWERWRDSVAEEFRFSVKMPKSITHTARLLETAGLLDGFMEEASLLGDKLACLLVQLPPSLALDERTAASFFADLRGRTNLSIACEPRHESWFTAEADALLMQSRIGRVAADPARVPKAAMPGGWRGLSYFRLHGSPRIYYSAYSEEFLSKLARQIASECKEPRDVWCIFDNTTLGAATGNALELAGQLLV
jgi:uncharacterized protein YecE (DUF72 family)